MRLPRVVRTSSFRLTLAYAGLFGVSVLALALAVFYLTTSYMVRQISVTVTDEIKEVMAAGGGNGLAGLQTQVAALAMTPDAGMYYLLEDATGRVLAGNLGPLEPIVGPRDWTGDRRRRAPGAPSFNLHGRGLRVYDGAYLFVGIDSSQLVWMEERVFKTFVWGFAATVILGLAGGTLMSLATSRRIAAITRTSYEIAAGDMSQRIALRGSGDEFDDLAKNLNTLFGRIQSLMAGLHQISADIAHDLRTPLTRLRQKLELAQRPSISLESLRGTIEGSAHEVDAILETFGALLRIAQIEAGTRKSAFVTLDFADILRNVVEIYQPVAEEKNQELTNSAAPGLLVRGDRELLTQMIVNLVENAVRHAPEGASIVVKGELHDGIVSAEVADTGPGIPAELRQKVFQRLFRLESSRTTPGSGLGLSMVAAIAALHGIAIELADNHPGLRVLLRFPRQDRDAPGGVGQPSKQS